MSHVILHAAEFPTEEAATRATTTLTELVAAFAGYERDDPNAFDVSRVPAPLAALGKRFGVPWPNTPNSRFLIEGLVSEDAHVLRLGTLVFFWAGGFDLGGPTLQAVLVKLGATELRTQDDCHVVIDGDPSTRVDALAAFLDDEDYRDEFHVDDLAPASPADATCSVTVSGAAGSGATGSGATVSGAAVSGATGSRCLWFSDQGVQDWAFVTLLRQLHRDHARLVHRA